MKNTKLKYINIIKLKDIQITKEDKKDGDKEN